MILYLEWQIHTLSYILNKQYLLGEPVDKIIKMIKQAGLAYLIKYASVRQYTQKLKIAKHASMFLKYLRLDTKHLNLQPAHLAQIISRLSIQPKLVFRYSWNVE